MGPSSSKQSGTERCSCKQECDSFHLCRVCDSFPPVQSWRGAESWPRYGYMSTWTCSTLLLSYSTNHSSQQSPWRSAKVSRQQPSGCIVPQCAVFDMLCLVCASRCALAVTSCAARDHLDSQLCGPQIWRAVCNAWTHRSQTVSAAHCSSSKVSNTDFVWTI